VAEVAKAQNDVFRAHGFGDYVTTQYTRTRGHGLGLWQSEPPIINEESKAVLKENMVMIVHPNTYMPGVGYLALGESIVVTKDGVEILTKADRELKSV
jgi:Xaa-Pro dipeptidase